MSEELVIKISGDTKGVKDAFADVKTQTDSLQANLNKTAEAAAGVFAGLGLEKIGELSHEAFDVLKEQLVGAVKAYADADVTSRKLTAALQNQGIFTTELTHKYDEYAESVQRLTGFEDTEVKKAQVVIQSFLGQIPVTEELTKAIADLAEGQGITLVQAAEEAGKAIGTGTGGLLRQGLQLSATSTEAERYGKVLEFVTGKYGGQAEAANKGLGALRGLESAFKAQEEELGARFAPIVGLVIEKLTALVAPAKDGSGVFTDFKAAAIVAGLAVTGLGVALPVLAQGFLILRAAALAANVELTATKVALAGLGIGLVIIAITELALHWETVSTRVKAIVQGLVTFVSGAFSGLGKILSGAFHLDIDKIKEGLTEIQKAFADGAKEAVAEIPKATEKALTEQDAVKKKFADKEAAARAAREANRIALQKAEDEAIMLELTNASEAQIELKRKEIETLKAIESSRNAEQTELLQERLHQLLQIEQDQFEEDLKREQEFDESKLAARRSLNLQLTQYNDDLSQKEMQQIKASQMTEAEADKKAYSDELKAQVAANNTFLMEQRKYGIAYAAINAILHSEEVQGVKQATGELTQLTQSKNSTLKAIGKAATIAQIVIKTAESAMNIYAGFSAIPIVGPVLGVAGAAAAVAFGAEQVGNVVSAAQGGLITGGIPGQDSVPVMAMPGELVVPTQNFEEVVGAVRNNRDDQGSGVGEAKIELSLKNNLMDLIETRLVQRKRLGISING